MLKDLLIQNLILMDSCSIELDPKLNVITGETGSGKTAILHGLKLLLGTKLDTSLIRKGAEKGFIQGRFEFPFPQELVSILENANISLDDSSLILSREVSTLGKSKNWINERLVSLSFLQKVGSFCIQIVDQNSCQELRHSDTQREILDCFASLQPNLIEFSKLFLKSKEIESDLERIVECERQKERELSFCIAQLEELNSIELQEGDEELLFQEYINASNAEEVSSKINQLSEVISQSPSSILTQLQQAKSICKNSKHRAFDEPLELLSNATISVQEALHLLETTSSDFDPDPKKQEILENKLSLIDRMKKKYGPSISDWKNYQTDLEKKIEDFENLEDEKLRIESEQKDLDEKLNEQASLLTKKRQLAANDLALELSKEIQSLNMLGASLEIKIEKQKRSILGEDSIHFWLLANHGESASLVKENSSGGELARILLALKLCLAEKNHTPTLIFDEIDAGVGGETARLIGEKLKNLSAHRQIICITHFPQVACSAHLHLSVEKQTKDGRTQAKVSRLDSSLREHELLRMLGGKKTLSFYENS
jgi:DNA repair protein RecN (Recombination protein N)